MDLGSISLVKIEQKIYAYQQELRRLREIEEAIKQLEELKEVLLEYDKLLRYENSPLFTDQKRRWLSFMRKYPYLALHKRWSGIQRFCSSYVDDQKSLDNYASRFEEDLRVSGFVVKMDLLLKDLMKDVEKLDEPKSVDSKDNTKIPIATK